MSNVLRRIILLTATVLIALLLTPATAAAQCTGGLANTLGIPGSDACGGPYPAIGSAVAAAAALGAAAAHAMVTYARGAAAPAEHAQPSLSVAGLATTAGRVGAVRDVFALRRAAVIYNALGDAPSRVSFGEHDATYEDNGAHTLKRHRAGIPLNRSDAPPGEQTIEGRIYGDKPWDAPATWSFRWMDDSTMSRTVNDYIQANWELIRNDLALYGDHRAIFDAGHLTGEGFGNVGAGGFANRAAHYAQTSHARVTLNLVPGDPSSFFVVTAFPAKTPPPRRKL